MDLKEFNEKINQLQKERDLLLFNENKEKEEFVKKLDWLKECDGVLYHDTFWSVGTPKYRIVLYGKCPDYKELIRVYGNKTDYYYNNIYYDSRGYSFLNTNPTLSTQSDETLMEFLKIYKLKSLAYDESYLKLLSKVNEIYDNKLNVLNMVKWWKEASTFERKEFLYGIDSYSVSPFTWYVHVN